MKSGGERLRLLWAFGIGSALGACWLVGDQLVGPSVSFLLVPWVLRQRTGCERILAAWGYYAAGSLPAVAAVIGYWGADHTLLGVAAWLGSSVLLSSPWALAARSPKGWGAFGICAALALTALPPLGVIGWLSPLNASGVLFPGLKGIGIALLLITFSTMGYRASMGHRSHRLRRAMLVAVSVAATASNLLYVQPPAPSGWVGVHTHVTPSRDNALIAEHNNESVIEAGLQQAAGARVVIFPEVILDDWLPGTRQQLALSVPADQLWIIGADTDASDAVVRVARGLAQAQPITRSAGLILGGNWLPGSSRTLQPAWWERTFWIGDKRIWAALCVEQVQPWTWVEALLQRPDVILAMSNGWWARVPAGMLQSVIAVGLSHFGAAGLGIEHASSRAWARLMSVPIVWTDNR